MFLYFKIICLCMCMGGEYLVSVNSPETQRKRCDSQQRIFNNKVRDVC